MSSQNDEPQVNELKKELFEMQARRKKIEDEILMNRIVLDNVSILIMSS